MKKGQPGGGKRGDDEDRKPSEAERKAGAEGNWTNAARRGPYQRGDREAEKEEGHQSSY